MRFKKLRLLVGVSLVIFFIAFGLIVAMGFLSKDVQNVEPVPLTQNTSEVQKINVIVNSTKENVTVTPAKPVVNVTKNITNTTIATPPQNTTVVVHTTRTTRAS